MKVLWTLWFVFICTIVYSVVCDIKADGQTLFLRMWCIIEQLWGGSVCSPQRGKDLRIASEAALTFASCVGGLKYRTHWENPRVCVCLCVCVLDTHNAFDCSALKQKYIIVCFFSNFRTGLSSLKWFPTWRNACATLRYIKDNITDWHLDLFTHQPLKPW